MRLHALGAERGEPSQASQLPLFILVCVAAVGSELGLSWTPPLGHSSPQANISDSTDPVGPWETHLGFRNSFFLWIM